MQKFPTLVCTYTYMYSHKYSHTYMNERIGIKLIFEKKNFHEFVNPDQFWSSENVYFMTERFMNAKGLASQVNVI